MEDNYQGVRLFVASIVICTWSSWSRVATNRIRSAPTHQKRPAVPEDDKLLRSASKDLFNTDFADDKRPPTFNELYKVGKKLGTGAFSVAYEAYLRANPKVRVAVKITKKRNISPDIERTIRSEIEIMQTLDHAHIVKYIRHFDEPSHWYVVLELLEGGEVFERIVKKSKYDEKEARDLVLTLLGAVQYLHDRDIVHRDLKLENLLLQDSSNDALVKVADFGFAKVVSSDPRSSECSQLMTQCGSPLYVCPEIILRKPYGKPADLWAIGVITYILLGGYPPFQDDGKQSILFANIVKANYEFDKDYWDHISEEAKDLIRGLLTIDPLQRITVHQALNHPWVARSCEDLAAVDLNINVQQMKKFRAKRKFRAAVSAVMAINKMSVLVRQNSPMPINMCSRSEYLRTPRPFEDSDDEEGVADTNTSNRYPSWGVTERPGSAFSNETGDADAVGTPQPTAARVRTYSDGTSSPWWN